MPMTVEPSASVQVDQLFVGYGRCGDAAASIPRERLNTLGRTPALTVSVVARYAGTAASRRRASRASQSGSAECHHSGSVDQVSSGRWVREAVAGTVPRVSMIAATKLGIAAAVVTATTVLVAGTGSSVAVAAPGKSPSGLRAGEQIVAGTSSDRLQSPNGEYILYLEPGGFVLDQFAPLTDSRGRPTSVGTDVWMRDDPTGKVGSTHDRSVLRLQLNGKLVLKTAKGRVLWSDGVAAGEGSTLSLTSTGNLVVRDRRGDARWASRTSAILLVPGRRLASGRRLVDRWDDRMHPSTVTSLTMGRDGDLVKRCNTHIVWRSRTHSPGAYLSMERSGDLVIRSAGGQVVWHTHTNTAGPLTYLDTRSMEVRQVTIHGLPARWTAKIPYDAPC